MKQTRFSISLILMASSLILLLILEGFWIQNSYERAYYDLERETTALFRESVSQIRDSLFFQFVNTEMDSLPETSPGSSYVPAQAKMGGDSASYRQIWIDRAGNAGAATVSTTPRDSGNVMNIQHIVRGIRFLKMHDRREQFEKLATDTVVTQHIYSLFRDTLQLHQLPLPCALHQVRQPRHADRKDMAAMPPNGEGTPGTPIHHRERNPEEEMPPGNVYSDTLHTPLASIYPGMGYVASLAGIRPFLVREVLPQILFSTFLCLITVAAFIVMYRHMRGQQRLMALKNDFISNVTHELQTPVATVSVALEALKNFQGLNNPLLTKEYLEIARQETQRLSMITDRILKTSLLEHNGTNATQEPVDLDAVIQQVLASLSLVFQKANATVDYQKEGAHFEITGSLEHITSVIYNLLDNALKYCHHTPAIHILLKKTPGRITLRVKDHGIGIAPEYQKKIFEKFFRVPTGNQHTIKGYGLGLNYVASVIKNHRGSITVESKPNEGSTFTITLPGNIAAIS